MWFGIQTLFAQVRDVYVFGGPIPVPVWSSVVWFAVVVATISFVGLWKFRWKVVPVVLASAAAGLVYKLVVWLANPRRADAAGGHRHTVPVRDPLRRHDAPSAGATAR